MRILRLPAYCYPEKMASSHLQIDRMEGFAKAGYTLVVHTPMPTRGIDKEDVIKYTAIPYEELFDGRVQIRRFPLFQERRNPLLRAIRYVLSILIQYGKGVREKDIDILFASSTPPIQGIMCGAVKKRLSRKYGYPIKMVYNLQDIFPDSLVNAGMTKKGSLLWKIGRFVEKITYESSDKIIVICESFKQNLLEKGVPEEKIVIIPNWINTEQVKPIARKDNKLFEELDLEREKFTVLYAGNFGASQGADIVLEAAKLLENKEDIQFVVFGGGSEFEAVCKKAEDLPNVTINPLLPQERVSEVYSLGDVALITCKAGVGMAGMPSKTWSIMACNTPIIASFDTESELAQVLQEANAGLCVEPENADALAAEVLKMYFSREESNSRDFVIRNASKEACVAKYIRVMEQTISE